MASRRSNGSSAKSTSSTSNELGAREADHRHSPGRTAHAHAPGGDVPSISATAVALRSSVTMLHRRLRAENRFPSLAQAVILGHLYDEGPRTTSWLAETEHIRPQSMAQTIRDLELAELVVRKPDRMDRRQMLVSITAEGERVLEEDRIRREAWFRDAILRGFTEEERNLLIAAIPLMNRLSAS